MSGPKQLGPQSLESGNILVFNEPRFLFSICQLQFLLLCLFHQYQQQEVESDLVQIFDLKIGLLKSCLQSEHIFHARKW